MTTFPDIPGVTFVERQEIHNGVRWKFYVDEVEAEEAAVGMLDALDRYSEIMLADPRKGDGEAAASFRQGKMRMGGHGWSGEWVEFGRKQMLTELSTSLQFNRGLENHDFGYLYQHR